MTDQKTDLNVLLQLLHEIYEEKLPFNRLLGLRIASLDKQHVRVRLAMREALIGNYVQGTLHGGVISSVLDATGGITASIGVLKRMAGRPLEEITKRLFKVGTIDLRVDYLRPGRGEYFVASGSIMRSGRKVSVARMELHNDHDLLIAVGTGTYLTG